MKGSVVTSNFQRLNLLTGWIVGLIACTVFILTMEPTGSFWDCGEFITSCNKLEIPHPPGAPLFILLGRFFIILFGDNPHTAARAVNCMSAIASGLSILFLFWTITHFARKLIVPTNSINPNNSSNNKNSFASNSSAQSNSFALNSSPQTNSSAPNSSAEPDRLQTLTILSAGAIGALAYTFCDSFWYSAVEGEVYATSAFFTAIVFWAILKWEQHADKRGSDKWLIFIFYMMGLSIGVHLLNLLTIPAIVMVYYFKRFRPTRLGTLFAFLTGCAITGFVQIVVIQYTIKGAGAFDVFFVNTLNLPFFSGFTTFFVLLAAALAAAIRWAVKHNKYYLKIGCWSAAFMLLGYSTYFTTMIRSNADTPVDMYNVDNPISLVGYLSRESYGDWPILYGPDFTDPAPMVESGALLVKYPTRYEVAGNKYAQDWSHAPSAHFFPRMYNSDNTRGEIDAYKQFSGMAEGDNPTMADNWKYFLNYQTNWMYLRYFMWNFAGKQNDLQGFGNPRDSNWVSGISFVDNWLYGEQSHMPDTARKNNKSYNRLFMLPLLLGLLGIFAQYRRNRRDTIVTGLLFFFTGWAIVMYLNQAGYQPRERDYAFAGSFYVFAIWIGLGVIAVQQLITRYMFRIRPSAAASSAMTRLTPSAATSSWASRLAPSAAAWSASAICLLAVPILMASQEWDDHDRSKKTLARDLAVDYLESCPPNAILFSFEDNDTYPIWYAQEVEGIRPDVRVIINTLSGTDWLLNSLRYKVNNAAPVDPLFTPDQIAGDKKSIAYFADNLTGFTKDNYYDLYDTFKTVLANDDPRYMTESTGGMPLNLLPTRKFSVPVDAGRALANGAVHPGEIPGSQLHLDISPNKRYLLKNELAMLAIIAANRWQRPICFTSTSEIGQLGLEKYARNRGLTYELTPIENDRVDNDVAGRNILANFQYGHAGTPGVYFDEENRRRLNIIKLSHAEIAFSLAAAGNKEQARRVLDNYDRNVDIDNFPYGMTANIGNMDNSSSLFFLQACYAADDAPLAAKVAASMNKDLHQQMRYYQSLGDGMSDEQLALDAQQALQGKQNNLSSRQLPFARDILSSYQILQQMTQLERQYHSPLAKPPM